MLDHNALRPQEVLRDCDWPKSWRVVRGGAKNYLHSFSGFEFVSALSTYLVNDELRKKNLELVSRNRSLPLSELDLAEIRNLSWDKSSENHIKNLRTAEGYGLTIKLRELHRNSSEAKQVVDPFLEFLSEPVGLNLYYTTPNSGMAIPAHRDAGDIFILQVSGAKKWFLEPVVSSADVFNDPKAETILTDEITLSQGDLLFVRQQTAHRTETIGDDDSLHLTIQGNSNVALWLSDSLRYWFQGTS